MNQNKTPTPGATVWLVQQCEAGTSYPLLDKPDSGTQRKAGTALTLVPAYKPTANR